MFLIVNFPHDCVAARDMDDRVYKSHIHQHRLNCTLITDVPRQMRFIDRSASFLLTSLTTYRAFVLKSIRLFLQLVWQVFDFRVFRTAACYSLRIKK